MPSNTPAPRPIEDEDTGLSYLVDVSSRTPPARITTPGAVNEARLAYYLRRRNFKQFQEYVRQPNGLFKEAIPPDVRTALYAKFEKWAGTAEGETPVWDEAKQNPRDEDIQAHPGMEAFQLAPRSALEQPGAPAGSAPWSAWQRGRRELLGEPWEAVAGVDLEACSVPGLDAPMARVLSRRGPDRMSLRFQFEKFAGPERVRDLLATVEKYTKDLQDMGSTPLPRDQWQAAVDRGRPTKNLIESCCLGSLSDAKKRSDRQLLLVEAELKLDRPWCEGSSVATRDAIPLLEEARIIVGAAYFLHPRRRQLQRHQAEYPDPSAEKHRKWAREMEQRAKDMEQKLTMFNQKKGATGLAPGDMFEVVGGERILMGQLAEVLRPYEQHVPGILQPYAEEFFESGDKTGAASAADQDEGFSFSIGYSDPDGDREKRFDPNRAKAGVAPPSP